MSPRKHLAMFIDIVILRLGAPDFLLVEIKDAVHHSTFTGHTPLTKNYQAYNVSGAKIEELQDKGLERTYSNPKGRSCGQ